MKSLLVCLYTAVNRGFQYKILNLDPSTHTSFESSRKGGSNGQIKIFCEKKTFGGFSITMDDLLRFIPSVNLPFPLDGRWRPSRFLRQLVVFVVLFRVDDRLGELRIVKARTL